MDLETRVDALEAKLRNLEDELQILRLLNSYGPLTDSGSNARAAALWRKGGSYVFGTDSGESTRIEVPAGLLALLDGEYQRSLIDSGSTHLLGTPLIAISGDTAEAVGYSYVIRRDSDHWRVERAAVNHWTLVRSPDGWRIDARVNGVVDGSPATRALLSRALASLSDFEGSAP